ncbi:hypothetical protein H7Q97_17785 [Ochrobactrum sp. CM-21-5]|nr:hypothetical protein [Ochrobactrum sp. CM-21-5]MBC2887234.1 hypothetical protein [Ochrobactrum sp. CM-21-5]
MADTPERIWIEQDDCPYFYEESELAEVGSHVTEYIRADLCHRPAPAATDTGLVRYDLSIFGNGIVEMGGGAYVRADQAKELLAAERAKTERWYKKAMDAGVITHSDGTTSHPMRKERDDLKADNAALTARVKELSETLDKQRELDNESTLHHYNRAKALETRLAAARKALEATHEAISEYYRYQTGGEMRGSYDGKPERNALWKSMYKARAALEDKP